MKRKSLLIMAGLLVISASIILGHYQLLTDTTDGLMKGLGIGILVVALLHKRKQSLKKRAS